MLLPYGILSRLFVLCHVYPMLSVSLDCPFVIVLRYTLTFICSVSCVLYVVSFSGLSICYCPTVFSYVYFFCVLCTLCCQFLWIVHLLLPYGILSRLFALCCQFLWIVHLLLPYGILSRLFVLCCQFLWIVHLLLSYGILLRLFVLCLVYSMLSISLNCSFVIALRYSLTFICSVSCVPYVVSFSGLSIYYCPTVFSYVYLSHVLCTLCCQSLWIVHLLLPYGIILRLFVPCLVYLMLLVSLDCPFVIALRYSLTFIFSVSCVPYVVSFSGLFICYCPTVFSYVYCSVSCVPYVVSFSGLSICYRPTVFSYVYLSCVFCTLCCQFLWIVHFILPFSILLRLFVLCLVYSMLSVSLDCPFIIALRYSLKCIYYYYRARVGQRVR